MLHALRTISEGRHLQAMILRSPAENGVRPSARDGDNGHEVEEDVRQIVAQLGVADFVYTVPVVVQGGGTRGGRRCSPLLERDGCHPPDEVARSRMPAARTAAAWVARRGGKAYRQGQGTRRMIVRRQAEGSTIVAYPVRAAGWAEEDKAVAGLPLSMDVSDWPVVIILDHPSIDGHRTAAGGRVLDHDGGLAGVEPGAPVSHGAADVCPAGAWRPGLISRFRLGVRPSGSGSIVGADARYADAGGPMSRPWLTASSLADPTGADLYRELLTRLWPPDA